MRMDWKRVNVSFCFSSWYLKAQHIAPKNGRPYNQLALLAVYTVRNPVEGGLFSRQFPFLELEFYFTV